MIKLFSFADATLHPADQAKAKADTALCELAAHKGRVIAAFRRLVAKHINAAASRAKYDVSVPIPPGVDDTEAIVDLIEHLQRLGYVAQERRGKVYVNFDEGKGEIYSG